MSDQNDLSRFPRPNVSVDIAVLTVVSGAQRGGRRSLAVLVGGGKAPSAGRVLPGRFLREGQTISDGVADALRIKAGLTGLTGQPRLLRVFDDPHRDPRGWTLSLGHSLPLSSTRLRAATGQLVAITPDGALESGESLLFDHNTIVFEATADIRSRYELLPDPDALLDEAFTMSELRALHEAVLGERLLKDTFRRRMEPQLRPLIEPDGAPVLRSDGGRPAQVYGRHQDVPTRAPRRLLPRSRG